MLTLLQNIISVKIIFFFNFSRKAIPFEVFLCSFFFSFWKDAKQGREKSHLVMDTSNQISTVLCKGITGNSGKFWSSSGFNKKFISPLETGPFTAVIELATGKDHHLERVFQSDSGTVTATGVTCPKLFKHYFKFKYSPVRYSFKGTQYFSNEL